MGGRSPPPNPWPRPAHIARWTGLFSSWRRTPRWFCPGPKIASEIGVSRSTVWQYIEKLRALGVEIKGHPSSGYQLQKLPDILAPSLIKLDAGEGRLGHRIFHYFRTDSTNSVALTLASKGAEHGTVVVAEEQTAGRGRLGRAWHSEKSSGIYVSVILRPPLAPSAAPILTLMAGLAVQQAILCSTNLAADIRWPNDVLISGKKVCGILTEMNGELDRLHFVVLGIGINVNHRALPDELKAIATSLRLEAGKPVSRVHVLIALLRELEKHYQLLLREGGQAIATGWAAAVHLRRRQDRSRANRHGRVSGCHGGPRRPGRAARAPGRRPRRDPGGGRSSGSKMRT